MTKFQLLAAAAAAALATACAGTQSAQTETQNLAASTSSSSTTTPSTSSQTTTPSTQTQTTTTPAPAQQQAQATPAPATPATPTTYTDDQLRSFARAAIEIDPISRTLTNATPEQTAAATEQIRQALARNNIDSATYNAIASRAQADPALASRIASLNRANPNG